MKLTFKTPNIIAGSVMSAATDPKISAKFHAPFTLQLAKALGVADMLFDTTQKPAPIRSWPQHGLKIHLPEAQIEMLRPPGPNGGAGKVKVIAGEVTVIEAKQIEMKDTVISRVFFTIAFGGNQKLEAFDCLFGSEHSEWRHIRVGGAQAELDFDAEPEEEAAAEDEEG